MKLGIPSKGNHKGWFMGVIPFLIPCLSPQQVLWRPIRGLRRPWEALHREARGRRVVLVGRAVPWASVFGMHQTCSPAFALPKSCLAAFCRQPQRITRGHVRATPTFQEVRVACAKGIRKVFGVGGFPEIGLISLSNHLINISSQFQVGH